MKKSNWVLVGVLIGVLIGGLLYRHFAQEVDSRGATRLMRAIEENDTAKTRKLLDAGSDLHARDKSGQTALFYAARYTNDPMILHRLIVAGADTFLRDKHGYTPLMAAAHYNPDPIIIMALAKQGGFTEPQEMNKNQALLLAARYNTATVIKTLLFAHASPGFAETDGKTAADYLVENEKLSDQEKADYRQVMLMLEILEAREQFASSMKNISKTASQKAAPKANKASVKQRKPQESVSAKTAADLQDKPTAEKESTQPVPQEKQMSEEEKQ